MSYTVEQANARIKEIVEDKPPAIKKTICFMPIINIQSI